MARGKSRLAREHPAMFWAYRQSLDVINSFDHRARELRPLTPPLSAQAFQEIFPEFIRDHADFHTYCRREATPYKFVAGHYIRFAEYITAHEELAIERVLRWKQNRPRSTGGRRSEVAPGVRDVDQADSFLSKNEQDFATEAMARARSGQHETAFAMLTDRFRLTPDSSLDRAITLLPAMTYVGYRYITPGLFVSRLRTFVAHRLDHSKPRQRCDPTLKHLCLFQLACIFNEGGQGEKAGEMLLRPELGNLWQKSKNVGWYRPQLVRNLGWYHIMHNHRPTVGLKLAEEATRLDPANTGNLRAVQQLKCLAHWNGGSYPNAWSEMESAYWPTRAILIDACATAAPSTDDLLHVFAAVFHGAIARNLARDKYPKADLEADVEALSWFIRIFGRTMATNGMLSKPPFASLLPPSLHRVATACERESLNKLNADVLWTFAQAVKEL